MKLSTRSLNQAHEVLHYIYSNNITRIHTRGALDRMIEIVKFPETLSKRITKKTVYKNQQYDPIRNWMIQKGYLTVEFDGYRYHYNVNK
jgi:hypothetical protein